MACSNVAPKKVRQILVCVPVSSAMRLCGILENVCFIASGVVGTFCSRMILLKEIESLNERIKEYDERMEKIAKEVYPEVSLLKQVKGVGTQRSP